MGRKGTQVPRTGAKVKTLEVAQGDALVAGVMSREVMENLSGMRRPLRPVRGEALVEAKDPTMVAGEDMQTTTKVQTSLT